LTDADASDERLRDRIGAEQDERRRLAELIHDGPVQHLAALSQMLDAATISLDRGETAAAREALARALAVAREGAADLRDLVADIEPLSLHEHGFAAAVRDLADRLAARRAIAVDVDAPAGDLLGDRARAGLYQVVREALDQAVRRGPPAHASVSLTQTARGGIQLVITDDAARERRQAVLDGLEERTSDLNGTFTYDRTDAATTITIVLPPSAAYV
jgi:signal transduction histidine kinase